MIKIPIPAELERITSPDNNKTIASAEGIYDYLKSKNQLTINAEVDNTLSSIQERLTETEVNSGDLNIDLRIDDKINELDSSTSGSWSNDGTVISVSINQSNGKVSSVSINVLNIASITLLLTLQSTIEALSEYIGLNNINITLSVVPNRPETGVANVVYRITGEYSYSDWMYNPELPQESRWILLATYGNAADNEPLPTSDNLIKSKGVANTCGYTSDSNEGWIYTIKDAEDKILFGIKSDGSINWYVGMPAHLKDYILENAYKWLKEEESEEFVYKITDAEDKILFGIKLDGEVYNANLDPKVISYVSKTISNKLYNNWTEFRPSGIAEPMFKVNNDWDLGQLGMNFGGGYNNYLTQNIDPNNPNVLNGKNYDWCDNACKWAKKIGVDVARVDAYTWRDTASTVGLTDEERFEKIRNYYKDLWYLLKKNNIKILAVISPFQAGNHWKVVKDRMWDPVKKKYIFDGDYLEYERKALQLFASKNLGICDDKYTVDGNHEPLDITADYIELVNEFDLEDNMYLFRWNGEFNSNGDRIYTNEAKTENWFNYFKMAYTTIKETNPNITVFMGGLSSLTNGTLQRLCDYTDSEGNRFWDFFDVFNFHSYAAPDELFEAIKNYKKLMNYCLKYKSKTRFIDKPVVVTEYGANTFDNTEHYVATLFPKKTIVLQAAGILTCFPFKLFSYEYDIHNTSWNAREACYGLIHNGSSNSVIGFFRNDGTNKGVCEGDGFTYMRFNRNDIVLRMYTTNMVNRLKKDGLIIKKYGNYTINKVVIFNSSDLYIKSNYIAGYRSLGTTIYSYNESEAQEDQLIFGPEYFLILKTNYSIVVFSDDVITSNKWDYVSDLSKPPFNTLKVYTTVFHNEKCSRPVLNLTEDGIFVASWINENKDIIYAIWSKAESKNPILINYTGCPVVYNCYGEVILNADLDNLDVSEMVYLTDAGNIKVKKV